MITIILGLLVIVMAIPVVARALPPEGVSEGLWGFLYELEERINLHEAGGEGTGEDFDLPTWTKEAYVYPGGGGHIKIYVDNPEEACSWHDIPVPEVPARAIASLLDDGEFGYAVGTCEEILFDSFSGTFPGEGETIQMEVYLRWMGKGEISEFPILVEKMPNRSPVIVSMEFSPPSGPTPLEVHFRISIYDPDGDELTYHWEFGDGETDDGELASLACPDSSAEEYCFSHTYENTTPNFMKTYLFNFTVSDGLESAMIDGVVYGDP